MKLTAEQQNDMKIIMDVLKNDPFFNKRISENIHYRVALSLDDKHFGCCLFTDEKAKNEFLQNYQQLVKTTGKKWGCAVVACEKEVGDQ